MGLPEYAGWLAVQPVLEPSLVAPAFGGVEWAPARGATRRHHQAAHAVGAEHPPPYSVKTHHIKQRHIQDQLRVFMIFPVSSKKESLGGKPVLLKAKRSVWAGGCAAATEISPKQARFERQLFIGSRSQPG
jgi:hypothetical protein